LAKQIQTKKKATQQTNRLIYNKILVVTMLW